MVLPPSLRLAFGARTWPSGTKSGVTWLCRLWQAMTGHRPDASVATILAASTPNGHCASDALLRTWHRRRLAVLHSIWTATRITASSKQGTAPAQASPSPSHCQLASRLALKTITSMIHHDWVRCNDDVRQISGVLAEGQGPQYDFGGISTFVVPQPQFGIDPHCSDRR